MSAPAPGGSFRVPELPGVAIRPGARTFLKRCDGCATVVAWGFRLPDPTVYAVALFSLCSACEERSRKEYPR